MHRLIPCLHLLLLLLGLTGLTHAAEPDRRIAITIDDLPSGGPVRSRNRSWPRAMRS